jgi:hypothetical protein
VARKRQSPSLPQPRKWYTYESLVVARLTALGGFITGVVGCLDWSPLLGITGFDYKQVIFTGGIVMLIGVSTEIARRRGAQLT